MKIAYIILAYKLPEQLVRLAHKLNTDTASFFIHVDKKTEDEIYKKMVKPLSAYKNVYFLKRHVCNWGDFGVVEATLDGIRESLGSELMYNYVILLTGQDYPIKSNRHIQKVLQKNAEKSFIEFFPLPSNRWEGEGGGMDRVTHWHFNWRGRRIAFTKGKRFFSPRLNSWWAAFVTALHLRPKVPKDLKLFGGSGVWCLTRDCVEYLNEFAQRNNRFVKFFKHVFAPDEIFFQTVLMNSHLKSRLVDDDLRYVLWNDSPHPKILGKQNFEEMINTDNLFARKFDMTVDADVLDMIDREIS